ncbi:type I restriction-modification system subunit M [Microbacterium sp. zg.Y1090]|uniref:class I SAM-dependent DNA methyltransferase n=1 Tax=Microbacterium wangruii TaxID=3049073 RepID=UPI00214DDE58|nr:MULTISPECIES: class I SAM-dependent DNA methyltransferase [unclassified Microbacterium]MCR2818933.1 type I restriction-modification system subunit M [Microbacterium sp. zg.Y1090]WIM27240.1 class I SAM-dependent DNA methyltransferase [Microbacterium sp. zg-Y1090]
MPPKNKQTQSLEETLWEAATALRSSMDAAEYKHVVLGLIFLKYVSDTFMVRHDELVRLVNDESSDYFMPNEAAKLSILEDRDEYTAEGVFWIPEGHRWADLKRAAKQADIGGRIDKAMEAIERENPSLKGVLPKTFSRQELTPEMLGGLIDVFSRNDLTAEEHKDLDVLGRVYEYFLGKFAGGEGKRGGQYYTPRSVVQLLVEMLQPYHGRVYDPACGSGGMFVQADKFVRAHGGTHADISVYGQESVPTTWRLAKMNLALRGIEANLGPEWGDSFHADKHPDLRADFVIANPPFNDDNWKGEKLRQDRRWQYGVPPVQNANFAWIQHMMHHLAPTGTMATVLANGSLSGMQNGEGDIRKALVDGDVVECIVSLPPQLFFGTQIPVCIWFLTKNKKGIPNGSKTRKRERETLFIDARQVGFMESRTRRAFDEADLNRIADAYHAWRGSQTSNGEPYKNIPGFCYSATTEEISKHGYILTPGRYVGAEDGEQDGEPLDRKIVRLASALRAGFEKRQESQERVLSLLDSLGSAHD